jgi:membrane protease subunit HflK
MQEADGYKQRVIANAEGDASRFKQVLVEYEKAPVVTRERMYIDMMQQIMSSSSKVLVDQKNGSNLLYLPLDKLIQSTGVQPSEAATAAGRPANNAEQVAPQPAALTEPATLNVREMVRGRDREARP